MPRAQMSAWNSLETVLRTHSEAVLCEFLAHSEPSPVRSIHPANPHLHESVGNAVNLCAFLVLIGQKLFLQQSADGVLD